ncbi:O-methyltransferase involved in polyketide biosynthesis [Actinocorallia herbida]|uniref:O-methyltransferase involved in polyketide biosynthesis n=1 Tax=Actinocorallia herbida TaxID=58109 RepID=A0A3N1CTP4_9ACTN|nr:O-methyltransferase involved in polyketide biosynthesis [Actinocorallia herbida]
MDIEQVPSGIDASRAHPARRYDYWLGGKDNFEADRESGRLVAAAFPTIRMSAIENRRFLHRAVRHLTEEAGIRQFLDIGAGLPSAGNVHEIAQEIAPESRVVYVDNDPIVLVHARALLNSSPEGRTAYLEADLNDPEHILGLAGVHETIDLSKPVALMLLAVFHFMVDDEAAHRIFRTLRERLAPGSYIVFSHATSDDLAGDPEEHRKVNNMSGIPFRVRTSAEVAEFMEGLELVEPGVSSLPHWRPNVPERERARPEDICMHGVVARIP